MLEFIKFQHPMILELGKTNFEAPYNIADGDFRHLPPHLLTIKCLPSLCVHVPCTVTTFNYDPYPKVELVHSCHAHGLTMTP